MKNIKTQKASRVISFLLALIFIVVGMLNGIEVVKSAYLFGFGDCLSNDLTVYDMNGFENDFRTDVTSVLAWSNRNYMQKQVEKKKTEFVDGMLSKYLESKSFYDENSQALLKSYNDEYTDYDGYDDDDGVDYDDASSLYNIQHEYDEFGNDVFYFQKDYSEEISAGRFFWFTCTVPLSHSGEQAQKYLEKKFDNEVTKNLGPYLTQTEVSDALQFYIESKDGVVYTNVDDVNAFKKNATADKGFWLGEDNLSRNRFYSLCNYDDFYTNNTKQAYFQIDMSKAKDDYYSKIQENFDKVNHNPMKNFAVSVACIILLLLLLIWNCVLAGRKGSEYKTSKIDKVPNDLHFLVSGGLVAGGFFLLVNSLYFYAKSLFSEMDIYSTLADMVAGVVNSNMFMPLVCALAFAIFLVMSEWLTSVARQVKAHSGFFKNTLVYMLIKCLVWLFKTVVAKPAKKGIAFLKYRPDVFKKQLMAYLIGYGVVNLLLLFFVWLGDDGVVRLLLCFAWFGLNAASLVFVVKYVMDLDEIIKAFNERRPPRVNYQKLPQSLKMLVDAQKYTAEELNRAVDKAVKDERMRSELITNVSHDLKTPLTSIITYVDLLKHCDIQDEKAQEYIGVLDEKGGRLKRLIDDLVEASKITSGVVKLNLVQLDLGELATQAVVEHQQEFADNGLELIFKGNKKSLSAIADGQKTYRVIENLLSNARKYSAKGSRVYADVYEQNNTAVFEIKNVSAQQLDISADELKERFVRGDKSRNEEGNGLGLSIADNLCQAMHGRMEIHIDGDLFKVKVVLPRQAQK
ncbi:HAMP domain-containing sensor histidine kinase [Eubacterium sp.]|uniref:sensor histidine kinase n=1 Tax=Eubacterium sp. TaxID=142586 RepID=UPI0025C25D5D|nr:HAMP domain-containing sensor histidine kinase [Eubacterium sp.]